VIALWTAQALSVMVLHKLLCAQKVNTVLQALKLPQLTVERATSAQQALLLKFPAHQATLVTALAILILLKQFALVGNTVPVELQLQLTLIALQVCTVQKVPDTISLVLLVPTTLTLVKNS
jgi:hypothetical protein